MFDYASTVARAILFPTLSAIAFHITFHYIVNDERRQRRQYRTLLSSLPVVIFPLLSLNSARDLGLPLGIRTLWTHGVLLYILHATALLYIEPQCSISRAAHRDRGLRWRISMTWREWTNFRLIRPITDAKNNGMINTSARNRVSFLFTRTIKIPVYFYLYFHITPRLAEELLGTITSDDLGLEKRQLLSPFCSNLCSTPSLTTRDFMIRGYVSVYWMWESFVWLDSIHSILAIISVATGVDRPESWPPLFGSGGFSSTLYQTTSVRRFWSHLWHRLIARSGASYGRFVACQILGITPGTERSDTVIALVVFSLSGMMHSLVAWQHYDKFWELHSLWFLLNFIVVCGERELLVGIRSLAKRLGLHRQLCRIERSWVGHLFGYIWVLGFFWWSVPFWQYPRLEEQALRVEEWHAYVERLRTIQESRIDMP